MKKTILSWRFISLIFTMLSIAIGVFLPQYILMKTTKHRDSVITYAPEEYYLPSNSAIAKKTSEQMLLTDKIKLITGAWESTVTQIPVTESSLSEEDAINLAIRSMQIFYENRYYPYSIDSTSTYFFPAQPLDEDDYTTVNDISYSVNLYKIIDNTFNTYSTYLWNINIVQLSTSLQHSILMTEDGTILAAQVSSIDNLKVEKTFGGESILTTELDNKKTYIKSIKNYYKSNEGIDFLDNNDFEINKIENTDNTNSIYQYPYFEYDPYGKYISAYDVYFNIPGNQQETCTIYQYISDNSYGFGIVIQ